MTGDVALVVDEVNGIGRLPAGGTLRLVVPPGTASAAVNLTATWPRGTGYLTAWPCDQPRPLASNLNFARHQTVANLAVTKVAADGGVCVFASEATHVVADLEATFTADAGVHTINPVRVLDTRSGPRPAANATVAVLPAMLIAPYRTPGKPPMSMPWANQMKLPSLTGDHTMRPSSGSSVLVVPGWLTRRVGALNGELIVAWRVSVAPAPPLLVMR